MQIIVLGANHAGIALVRKLFSSGHDVILVDPEVHRYQDLLEEDIIRMEGVIFDIDVLKEAGVESADAVCAMSESQNQNLMAAEIAHKVFHVPKVIARIFDTHRLHIFDEEGFVTISSPELTVDAFVSEIETITGEKPVDRSELMVFGNEIRLVLLDVDDKFDGYKISEVEDTEGRHVFGIVRDGQLRLTLPGMKLKKGDKIVMASCDDHAPRRDPEYPQPPRKDGERR